MTLTECKRAMEEMGFKPTKSLGQNFLIDGNILRIIIEAADVRPDETVLEIGAGMGVLTGGLLEAGANVIAIEKDAKLATFLKQRFSLRKRLTLIHADALALDSPLSTLDSSCKVIANLPYSISTAILRQFVDSANPPCKMVLMLQREVGERLAAKPGTADYSQLSVFTQAKYRVSLRHIVSRRCFYPAPDVDSAVVVLDNQPHPEVDSENWETFQRIVHAGFGQRRKQFAKLLRHDGFSSEEVEKGFALQELPLDVRAEALSLEQFLRLAKELSAEANASERKLR